MILWVLASPKRARKRAANANETSTTKDRIMTAHPCTGHACDHCYCCDVLGICCATIPAEQRARLEAGHHTQAEALHAAIVQEAGSVPSLGELVRLDARRSSLGELLPAAARLGVLAAPAADPLPIDSRKEAVHVIPAHTSR